MFNEEILSFARERAGEEGGDILPALCKVAGAELLSSLRQGVSPEEIREQFVSAAGVLALSMYIAVDDSRVSSFRAGNLSVSTVSGQADADSLRALAETMLASYLTDQGFAFLGVEG